MSYCLAIRSQLLDKAEIVDAILAMDVNLKETGLIIKQLTEDYVVDLDQLSEALCRIQAMVESSAVPQAQEEIFVDPVKLDEVAIEPVTAEPAPQAQPFRHAA